MRHDGFEGFVFEGFGFEVFGCLCIHRQGGGTHTHPHPASMHVCSGGKDGVQLCNMHV